MTVRFSNRRLVGYVAIIIISAVVLGISANFAALFLPKVHHDFTIFSLIVPSLTILVTLLIFQMSQPRIEVPVTFILDVLWLAEAAWATDIIGYVQCDALSGQRTAKNVGDTSAKAYCYQMKVIQAFSWMAFCLFAIFLIILFSLVDRAQSFGRHRIWKEPIQELPWFGEMPGYYNQHSGAQTGYANSDGYPHYAYPGMQNQYQGVPMYSQPTGGQTTIIQPGTRGQPATITTVPGTVMSGM